MGFCILPACFQRQHEQIDTESVTDAHKVGFFTLWRVIGMPCYPYPSFILEGEIDNEIDPLRRQRVSHFRDALALMVAESFYTASELQQEIAQNRIKHFQAGFSGAGSVRAMLDPKQCQAKMSANAGEKLTFYLGEGTRIMM